MKPLRLVVIGASGGCADLIDLARDVDAASTPVEIMGCLDDRPDLQGSVVYGAMVLGGTRLIASMPPEWRFITAIGNSRNFRQKPTSLDRFRVPADRWATLIHPCSTVSRFSTVGAGSAVFSHVTIGPNVSVGRWVHVAPNTVISHDTRIGDYSIITAGCVIAGNVTVGAACYLGARAVVRDHVSIGGSCLVGMGSVVVSDVATGSTVFGNPARVHTPS